MKLVVLLFLSSLCTAQVINGTALQRITSSNYVRALPTANFATCLVTDNATTTQFMSSVSTVAAGNLAQRFQYDINGGVLPRFQEVGVILQWQAGLAATDAPIVRSVEVEIETTNIVPTT